MYPLHKSETGIFQELARSCDVKFGQLNYLSISPGSSRGGHYHKRKEEWFCCINGRCNIHLLNINTNSTRDIIIDADAKEFIKIEPFQVHSLTNLNSLEKCEILIVISEEYNEKDPDTYVPI